MKQAPAEQEEGATPKSLIEVVFSTNIYLFILLFAFKFLPSIFKLLTFTLYLLRFSFYLTRFTF